MPSRLVCHACSAGLDFDAPVGRSQLCPKCGAELRCCLNCRFYDVSSYNECLETSAERVLEKDRGNFCDYFAPNAAAHGAAPAAGGSEGLSELEKLFRK